MQTLTVNTPPLVGLRRSFDRVLIVNSLHFVQKHFRHQDTKTQRLIFTNRFALCLCALVAIFPAIRVRIRKKYCE
jgi:hypothetical protein